MDAFRLNNFDKTAVATHIREPGHPLKRIEDDLKILRRQDKGRKLDLLEQLEIIIHNAKSDVSLNEQVQSNTYSFFKNFVDLI